MFSIEQPEGLIWYYWYKHYIQNSQQSQQQTFSNISNCKQKYHLESIDNLVEQKLKQKHASLNNPSKRLKQSGKKDSIQQLEPLFLISPGKQLHIIEQVLRKNQKEQYLTQLYSYYVNVKCSYLIGSNEDIIRQIQSASGKEKDEQQLEQRNDSVIDSFDLFKLEKVQNQIDQLQLGTKLAQFDGVELINCKYKSIPHTFVRVKKNTWLRSLQLNTKIVLNPCQPRTIGNLPILPRISKLKPHPSKVQMFVAYMQTLSIHYPTFSPTIDSIYEYNNQPYVFAQQDGGWQSDRHIGLLCYYVAFGNVGGLLNEQMVDRWIKQNSQNSLVSSIKKLKKIRSKIQKQRRRIQQQKIGIIVSVDEDIW